MNNNNIKSELLGMPFGTATNRLRKMLLFKLVVETQRDICYRCAEKIKDIDDFSIEHTVSWQFSKNPIETFFDIDKIAFSHLVCNVSGGRKSPLTGKGVNHDRPNPRKRQIVNGELWCTKGGHWQKIEQFGTDSDTHLGKKAVCKPCRKDLYRRGLSR